MIDWYEEYIIQKEKNEYQKFVNRVLQQKILDLKRKLTTFELDLEVMKR